MELDIYIKRSKEKFSKQCAKNEQLSPKSVIYWFGTSQGHIPHFGNVQSKGFTWCKILGESFLSFYFHLYIVKWYYFTKFSIINWQLKQVDCFNGAWYLHQKIKREIQQTMCKKWAIKYKLSLCFLGGTFEV